MATIGTSADAVSTPVALPIAIACDCEGCRFAAAGEAVSAAGVSVGEGAGDATGVTGAEALGEGAGVTSGGGVGGGVA